MRPRLLALLCVALVTAGCSGFVGGGSGGAPEDGTLTPAPVPPQPTESEPTTAGVAPGISATNVTDPDRLAEAHVAVASSTSFRWESTLEDETWVDGQPQDGTTSRRVVVRNGTAAYSLSDFNRTTNLSPDGDGDFRRLVRAKYATANDTYTLVHDGTVANRTFHHSSRGRADWEYEALPADVIRQQLSLEETNVYRVDVGERPHYLINGTRTEIPPYRRVENFSARAIVREDGLVRSLEVSYIATTGGERRLVSYRSHFTEVGTATVEEPGWLSKARSQVEESTADAATVEESRGEESTAEDSTGEGSTGENR